MRQLLIGTFALLLGLPACTSEDSGPLEGGTPEQAAFIWLIYGGGLRAISPCDPSNYEFTLSPGDSRILEFSETQGPYAFIGCADSPIDWRLTATPGAGLDVGISVSNCLSATTVRNVNTSGAGVAETLEGSAACSAGSQELNLIYTPSESTAKTGTAVLQFSQR